jgi:putative transposase
MKKSKFSEEQIATALRQVDAGAPVPEVTRTLGISEATYYVWRKRYGQMAIAEIRRLRQLEEENRKLKQLVADLTLDKVILQGSSQKKSDAHAQTRAGADRHRALLDRCAASVWAAEIESGVVVLPPSWAGRYRASPAVAGAGPGPPAIWLSPPARHAATRGVGGEPNACASHLS